MALFVNQESNRSKLQERLAAELSEKSRKRAAAGDVDRPDGVDDSAYMEGTKKTSSLMWLWIVIGLSVVVAMIWLVIVSLNR